MIQKIIVLFVFVNSIFVQAQQQQNVLFIAVDDLKPMLGCYGDTLIKTPAIDALAGRGIVFTNAHCQQAICGPSRASIMTGTRPDFTGVWDLKTRMRDVNPDILTIPQYFKNNGYTTVAVGKIYDPRCVDKSNNDGESWSIPYKESARYVYPEEYGAPALSYYADAESKAIVNKYTKEAIAKGENVHAYVSKRYKPSVECIEVDDAAYMDTQIANNAITYLRTFANEDEPFFLAVGFKRPHLPFCAPKKYWDLYNREDMALAEYSNAVKNGVEMAYHKSGEMYTYTDIPELTSFSDIFSDNLPEWKQKELIHGYHACVSYIDAQVKRILDELKCQGLDHNTTIVFWGDHGWHLGDHALWCKHTNFEQATRVPLIVYVPSGSKGINDSPVEFVDVFPTLCDVADLDIPKQVQGKSLMPILKNKTHKVKNYAVSQYGRGSKYQGYSIRTEQYRLTLWLDGTYRTFMPFTEDLIKAGELYDYINDPNEMESFYNDNNYTPVKEILMQYFDDFILEQNVQLKSSSSAKEWKCN